MSCWSLTWCKCSTNKSRHESLSDMVPVRISPTWLDAQFVQLVLRKQFSDSVEVHNVKVEAAVEVGENFACNVYRVEVEASSGPMSMIFKFMPHESEERAEFVREIMTVEKRMYERTLPLLRGQEKTPNYPHCYDAQQDGIRDYLALQDLRPRGFRTRPRHLGLDVAHCRLALKQLAHLHGFSAALRAEDSEKCIQELQCYTEKLYTERIRKEVDDIMKLLADTGLKKLPMRFHDISHLMLEVSSKVLGLMVTELTQINVDSDVLVLNHGDFWFNNMMFEYAKTSEEPAECVMIDFQMCRYAPPVFDILYVLYTSTNQAMRREHCDELLRLYLDEARWALAQKGVHQPSSNIFYSSLDELKKDMKRHSTFGFFSACLAMPHVLAHAKDLDNAMSPYSAELSDQLFITRLKELLEDFDDLGFFNELQTKIL